MGDTSVALRKFTDASHAGGITRYSAQFTALVERAARATTR